MPIGGRKMTEKTEKNLYDSYNGESKAVVRLNAFARKAEEEEYEVVAKLFRAVAESEFVHAMNSLKFLNVIKDTETNLEESLAREEKIAQVSYDKFLQEAEEEGKDAVAKFFSHARDAEDRHAKLYSRALEHLVADEMTDYYVCQVCGYVADGSVPEKCPICGVPEKMFKKVD